jgi:two-component system phosphate regulon sensor histidine kinase PhoR
MHQGLRDEIQRILVIASLALLVGFLAHQMTRALLVAGFFYTCWLLYQTRNFYLWLESNMENQPPDSGGIWGDIFDGMYRMRQSNIRAKEQMQQQLDRVQEFTSALQSGIVLLNAQGNLVWWNRSAEKLFGFKSQFDPGKPVINLLRDPTFVRYFQSGQESGHYDSVIVIPSPINPAVFLEIQMTTYGHNEKLIAVQDVTHFRQLEQMRKDFVSNVSHELRTPLTVINGYLEMIHDNLGSFDDEWRQPLAKIYAQAQRMTNLVTDLSTLSKLDSHDVTDKNDPVAVAQLIEHVVEDARQVNWGKIVTITLEGSPFNICGSETELQSCFSNLVYNAAKYSKASGGNIRVRYWTDDNGGHVSINDDGIGIDPIHIPRLTERFYRVDSSHSRKTGGTGLGLAIVKHALLRHGGRLTIDSAPGKESTFTCHFRKDRIQHT